MAYIDILTVSSPHQSEVAKISFFIASLSHEFHVTKMVDTLCVRHTFCGSIKGFCVFLINVPRI